MTHERFIFEPSSPDPGLPSGVFDPSTPEAERIRAPETQEAVSTVTRPRDAAPETITQEQLAPPPPPELTVQIISPETLADTDVIKAMALSDIDKVRPRDDVADALAAIDAATQLGAGDFAAITNVEALPIKFVPVSSDLFTGTVEDEPSAFDKSLQVFGIDPERAKTAIQTVAIGAGVLIAAPLVIRAVSNIFGAFQTSTKGA